MSSEQQETTQFSLSRKLYLLIALAILSIFLTSCLDLANNTVQIEIPSPGAKYKAAVFNRDAGATTDFSTQISVLGVSDRLPAGAGNVFICDSGHGKVTDNYDQGGPRVAVHWESDTRLVVEVPNAARFFKKETKIGEVEIEYLEKK